MASATPVDRSISRVEAAHLLACKELRKQAEQLAQTIGTLEEFEREPSTQAPAMLPVSDVGFVYGHLDSQRVHCPMHNGYGETVFNAQSSTFGIPAPPSKSDVHGWFVQKSLHDAVSHARQQLSKPNKLANMHEMAVVGKRRTVDSAAEAFHIVSSAAAEIGLQAPSPALFASAASSATSSTHAQQQAAEPDDDEFAGGFSDLGQAAAAAQPAPGATRQKATPATATPSGIDEVIKTRDDSALWKRIAELEAAEAAAGHEVVWSTGRAADMHTVDQGELEEDGAEGGGESATQGVFEIVEEEDAKGQLLRGQTRRVPSAGRAAGSHVARSSPSGSAVGGGAAAAAQHREERAAAVQRTSSVVVPVLERSAAPTPPSAPVVAPAAAAVAPAAAPRQSRFKQRMSQLRR